MQQWADKVFNLYKMGWKEGKDVMTRNQSFNLLINTADHITQIKKSFHIITLTEVCKTNFI